MITFQNDFHGFADRFSSKLNSLYPTVEKKIKFLSSEDPRRLADCGKSPMVSNPHCSAADVFHIVYNGLTIQSLGITECELWALVAHEVGHIVRQDPIVENTSEIELGCDAYATSLGLQFYLATALLKMEGIIPENQIDSRIAALSNNIVLYRPEWTCGRYNAEHQVALMYNLATGTSFFFESFSAVVVGVILGIMKGCSSSIIELAGMTEISVNSLIPFFSLLQDNGLLQTDEYTNDYREFGREPNNTIRLGQEDIHNDISSAEQDYFDRVQDDSSVLSAMFELTYNCSEKCIHCYNPGATRNDNEVSKRALPNELTFSEYKKIIDDCYEHGLVKVTLSGGDPLAKPIFWEILEYLYAKDIAVDIYTNAQLLKGQEKRLLSFYPRVVGISIYSAIPHVHDNITRTSGSFSKTMDVVKILAEYHAPMAFKCCVMQPNLHTYFTVADLAERFNAQIQYELNIAVSNDGDMCAKQLRLSEKQLQIILRDKNIGLYVGDDTQSGCISEKRADAFGCKAGFSMFCISPNGQLTPCCGFPLPLGNLREHTLGEILRGSSRLKEWRSCTLENYDECGTHTYCDYCSLCPGCNYVENGDFRVASEMCCRIAKSREDVFKQLKEGNDPLGGRDIITATQSLTIDDVVLKRMIKKDKGVS